jgi:all-trans-8'-apo-beta-carotenal 15,15'-oxygenase
MNTPSSVPGERARQRGWRGEALHAAFAAAELSRPWTLGYRSLDSDRIEADAQLNGRLPSELRGTLFRNGPARHERGGQRYGHRWDGDGMIQRFRLADGRVSHLGQYVQTKKYTSESASDRLLVSGFGTHIPGSDPVPADIDDVNPANISVLHFAGELLALWEAGSPYRLDSETLATEGLKTWGTALTGRPFSAHPKVEPDGSLWNFGIDPLKGELTVYHVAADGRLLHSHVVQVEQLPPTHDFAVTEHHLVFLLPPLVLNRDRLEGGAAFAESCQWSPTLGMRVLTIDKKDWSQRSYALPPGCLFHVANAWEDKDGTIRLQYMRSDDPMSLLSGWSVMRGEYQHQPGARLTSLVLDPVKGTATQFALGEREGEFPVIAPNDVGQRYDRVLCVERSDRRPTDVPGFDQIALIDIHTGAAQRFPYGEGWQVEEHLLVAAHGERVPRWVAGTALDTKERSTVLSIFDVENIGDGPVAQARLPYPLPLGLHGTFVLA